MTLQGYTLREQLEALELDCMEAQSSDTDWKAICKESVLLCRRAVSALSGVEAENASLRADAEGASSLRDEIARLRAELADIRKGEAWEVTRLRAEVERLKAAIVEGE